MANVKKIGSHKSDFEVFWILFVKCTDSNMRFDHISYAKSNIEGIINIFYRRKFLCSPLYEVQPQFMTKPRNLHSQESPLPRICYAKYGFIAPLNLLLKNLHFSRWPSNPTRSADICLVAIKTFARNAWMISPTIINHHANYDECQ